MIKAFLSSSRGPLVFLGLSHRNLDNLRAQRPILIHGDELGITCDILLQGGETEETIQKELLQNIGEFSDEH